MLQALKSLFLPNRIAAISTFLAGTGAQVSALAGAFEGTKYGPQILFVGGLLTQAATAITFLKGSQRHEARASWLEAHGGELPPEETPTPEQLDKVLAELTEADEPVAVAGHEPPPQGV